jgi:ABC-2 type transport system ATP-binding protein
LNPPTNEVAIWTQGLTKSFGSLTAVANLNLEVSLGEAFALVGPDGAGKTTTMRLLCGIMKPDRGQAEVLGNDTIRSARALKEHIGYMPQRFGLYDDLTVAENITFYADLYQVPGEEFRKRFPELLSFANLDPFQNRLAANLSGGMRQKLGLVCALIHKPRLLLLDEPTYGVDPVSRREFWEILYGLLGEGLTIFLSTAYMDEAERAHRVGLIHQGQMLLTDTPQAIRETFQGDLLEVRSDNLREAKGVLSAQEKQPEALVHQVLSMGDRLLITVADSQAALTPLQEALHLAGLHDIVITSVEPALEDLFVQIVKSKERVSPTDENETGGH